MRVDEDRKKGLEAELERLARMEQMARLDSDKVKADVKARASDIRALLGRHIQQARQVLRRVLVGKIEMKPVVDAGRRGYRFTGALSVERVLTGIALDTRAMVVAPTGFEPVFQSRPRFRQQDHRLRDAGTAQKRTRLKHATRESLPRSSFRDHRGTAGFGL